MRQVAAVLLGALVGAGAARAQDANPPAAADDARLRAWIEALGAEDYEERERATEALAGEVARAEPFLREALGQAGLDPEVRERIGRILVELDKPKAILDRMRTLWRRMNDVASKGSPVPPELKPDLYDEAAKLEESHPHYKVLHALFLGLKDRLAHLALTYGSTRVLDDGRRETVQEGYGDNLPDLGQQMKKARDRIEQTLATLSRQASSGPGSPAQLNSRLSVIHRNMENLGFFAGLSADETDRAKAFFREIILGDAGR